MPNAFIRKLQALAPLDKADVEILIDAMATEQVLPPRRDLVRVGDPPGPIFVMLDGWGCRYQRLPTGSRQITAFLLPGDSCDLHAGILPTMDHSIQTLTEASVATIPRAKMDTMLLSRPRIATALYTAQLVDEATSRAWIVSMGRRNATERIAHLMCELYLRAHGVGMTIDSRLFVPIPQSCLSDALGLTPVHVNRVLKSLRLDGALRIQRGSLTIVKPDLLARIAGFDQNYLHRRLANA